MEPVVDADAEDEFVSRAIRGTRVNWCNSYFYITDDPGYNDVKIRLYTQWTSADHLGHSQMSKTLTPIHFGDARDNPRRAYMLLKAWGLWRASQGGWDARRRARSRELQQMSDELEQEIKAFGNVRGILLGNSAAAAKLQLWVPQLCARITAVSR